MTLVRSSECETRNFSSSSTFRISSQENTPVSKFKIVIKLLIIYPHGFRNSITTKKL